MRNAEAGTVDLTYVVEEGPRVYVERIKHSRQHAHTRLRHFAASSISVKGDPYKQGSARAVPSAGCATWAFSRTLQITTEPSMSPDRVVLNIDVEDKGDRLVSRSLAAIRRPKASLVRFRFRKTNFLGRGQAVPDFRRSGAEDPVVVNSHSPSRISSAIASLRGFDVFSRFTDETDFSRYENRKHRRHLALWHPFDRGFQRHGTIFALRAGSEGLRRATTSTSCRPPFVKARGKTITSLVGLTFSYNTLDDIQNPRKRYLHGAEPRSCGHRRATRKFFRVSADARYYYEFFEDVVGVARAQAGYISGFGKQAPAHQ